MTDLKTDLVRKRHIERTIELGYTPYTYSPYIPGYHTLYNLYTADEIKYEKKTENEDKLKKMLSVSSEDFWGVN